MENNNCYQDILNFVVRKYRGIFESLYKFNDEVFEDNLLYYLFDHNYVVVMEDEGRPHLYFGESSQIGGIDRYGYVRRGIARVPDMRFSQDHKYFDETNSVVIYSGKDKHSVSFRLWELLTEIATILIIEQNNRRLSNVVGIIEGSPASRDTMANVFSNMFLNSRSYVVVKDKDRVGQDINKIDLDVKLLSKEHQASMLFYHNQVLEILGINFTPHEKAERLITNEVDSNNQLTQSVNLKFEERINRYLEKINKMFNVSLTMEKNEVVIETVDTEREDPENE